MRILLAEDEKRMAAALVALLKREKYDVDHVADGVSALAALKSDIYDIAVLDVMMPEMNGFEVAHKVFGQLPDIFFPSLVRSPRRSLVITAW